MAASPNGTILTGTAGAITDSSGNTWSLVSTPNDGLRIAFNGTVDGSTFFVTKLQYYNGQVYQENINNDWWYKITPSSPWTATNPLPSPNPPSSNGAIVTAPASQIVDAAGNAWSLVSTPNYGQQVALNGIVDPSYNFTAFVTELEYANGKIYQENVNGDWWYKTTPSSPWTPTDPPFSSVTTVNGVHYVNYSSSPNGSPNGTVTPATANDTWVVENGATLSVPGNVHLGPNSLIIDAGGGITLLAPTVGSGSSTQAAGPQDDGTIQISTGNLILRNPAFLGPREHIELGSGSSLNLWGSDELGTNIGGVNPTGVWTQNASHSAGMMDYLTTSTYSLSIPGGKAGYLDVTTIGGLSPSNFTSSGFHGITFVSIGTPSAFHS